MLCDLCSVNAVLFRSHFIFPPYSSLMPIKIQRSEERGSYDHGWLKTKHSFSFADYYDPKRMGFGKLRVLNEDIIMGGQGFGMHPHRDMEIVTIVLSGSLEHRDSMGNHGIIRPGDVQRMSAGTGIVHSEANASRTEPCHLLQIWVETAEHGIPPGYEQQHFDFKKNELTTVVSGEKKDVLHIHQNAYFSMGIFDAEKTISYKMHHPKNAIYVFVIEGALKLGKDILKQSDAAEIIKEKTIGMTPQHQSHILLVEIPYYSESR